MAKIKYALNLDGDFNFDSDSFDLHVNGKGTNAVWLDEESGVSITLMGKNLSESEENPDMLGGGKFTSVTVEDAEDRLVFSVTDVKFKAADISGAYEANGSPGIAFFLTSGDDRVVGSNKAQIILGGAGDDVMTGKGGSDHFIFQGEGVAQRKAGAESDVITDFDVKGDDRDTLQINYDFTLHAKDHGHDTLLRFENGSTLLLEDVTMKQFEHYQETMWN